MTPLALEELPVEQARLLDRLCDRYEACCRAGSPPAFADLLAEAPEDARPTLFRELLRLLRDQCDRAGRPLAGDDARARFAALGPWATSVLDEAFPPACVLTVEAGPPGDVGRTFRLTGHATFVVGRDGDGANFALAA